MKHFISLATLVVLLGNAECSLAASGSGESGILQVGISYYKKGDINHALQLFKRAAQQAPKNEKTQLWLAKAYLKQGGSKNLQLAKDAFERVLEINPHNLEALTQLGETLSWEPVSRDKSLELLKRAVEDKPGDPVSTRRLVEALSWDGRYEEALHYADSIADTYSKDKFWAGTYANILANTGHADKAIPLYEGILGAPESKDLALKQAYATALYQKGNIDDAKKLFNEVKEKLSQVSEAKRVTLAWSLGGLAFNLGLYGESLELDKSVLGALSPKDVVATKLRMARAYSKSQKISESLQMFYQLYQAGYLKASEKLEFADLLMAMGPLPDLVPDPKLVEKLLQETLQEATEQGPVYLRLARYYSHQPDQWQAANEAFQKAMEQPVASDVILVRKEYLDFLKSSQVEPEKIDKIFQDLLQTSGQDEEVQGAYSEFLSWHEETRPESIKLYVALAQKEPEHWKEPLEKVLSWHQPMLGLIPVYQQILELYPDSTPAHVSLAKAYLKDPSHYEEGLKMFRGMVELHPDDPFITREWLNILIADEKRRKESLSLLQKITTDKPDDMSMQILYAKVLSYEHEYGKALERFDKILSEDAKNHDALIGKGYTLLWDGKKLAAKRLLVQARTLFPKDLDLEMALAEVNKALGRYDEVLQILREIRQLKEQTFGTSSFIYCDYETSQGAMNARNVTYDFSILPYSEQSTPMPEATEPVPEKFQEGNLEEVPKVLPEAKHDTISPLEADKLNIQAGVEEHKILPADAAKARELSKIQEDLQALNASLDSLRTVQKAASKQINQMHASLRKTKEGMPAAISIQTPEEKEDRILSSSEMLPKSLGQFSSLDYDTNPLLSGMGRFKTSSLGTFEQDIESDLRPMIRGGYYYLVQEGGPTTSRLRGFGFPNQLSLSLTPQIRIRGGIVPRRLDLPRAKISPSSTEATTYSWGATAKPLDWLTLDGDMAITHFDQTQNSIITYQNKAIIDLNDEVHLKIGSYRYGPENSLLSYAGQKPFRGPFARTILGQARETNFYAQLNTNPFRHVDFNLGYEWGFVTGSHLRTNYKNQFFTSLGYTQQYAKTHQARVGYEFLFFGYSKNATLGYFNLDDNNPTKKPLVVVNPVVVAPAGTTYGGYFSPEQFFLNSFRLDLQGSFLKKYIEYKLGGSIGVQTVTQGHGINEPNHTSFASSFDGNVIFNHTDWFATYINGDYIQGGGFFNRWRFGGGVIFRPDIPALSPIVKR